MFRVHSLLVMLMAVAQCVALGQSPVSTVAKLRAGPMVGRATETEAMLWVQTLEPAEVVIRYWSLSLPEKDQAAGWRSHPVRSRRADDCCAHVTLVDLPMGTRFGYEVYVNGVVARRPYPLEFSTQPHWKSRTDPPKFTVAVGSCAFINDPEFDRPGEPYGGDTAIFGAIARDRPQLMIWLGDNLYYREPDWSSESGMLSRYRKNRSHPALQPLLGSVHHYAIWDDHDFGPNNSDRSFVLKDRALRAFKLYWANPTYGTRSTPGVFTRFTWGDVDFFLLDDRYHRSPNNSLPKEKRTMFGKEQLTWLIDGLVSSGATFKVIASGNQMLNPMTFYEALGNFPADQNRLLDALKRHQTSGVFFLSGDRHHTELIKLEREGDYPLYDYTSSPLLSGVHKAGREANNPARVSGTLVNEHRNYGLLRFMGPRTDRRMILECKSTAGKRLWIHEIRASDLRRKK